MGSRASEAPNWRNSRHTANMRNIYEARFARVEDTYHASHDQLGPEHSNINIELGGTCYLQKPQFPFLCCMPGHPEGYCPRPAFDVDQVIDIRVVLRICSACQSIMPTFYAYIYTYTTLALITQCIERSPHTAPIPISPQRPMSHFLLESPMFHEVTSTKEVLYAPLFMYAPILALSMDWSVAVVSLLGLELVRGSQKMDH
jgi:hypothetical protein